ncbi:hypothetical protein EV2_046554 [Malus domestica]
MMYEETKKIPGRYTEGTLGRIHLEVVLTHAEESLSEIVQMCLSAFRFDDNIVDINFDDGPIKSWKMVFIARWYVAPAFLRPNGMITYS